MTDEKKTDPFTGIDRATLESWAGAKTLSRGKEYQRNRRVSSLARSQDGTLIEDVAGSEPYVTAVTGSNGLASACTCPVGESCKHAVAVILEYIALCEKKIPVPSLAPDDPRIALLGLRSAAIPLLPPYVTSARAQPPPFPVPE